jgi:hypothetical protein
MQECKKKIDTSLNKTEAKLLSILIFARPFPKGNVRAGAAIFRTPSRTRIFVENGKNLFR